MTGDPLKAQVGFPISEFAQPLPGPVRQDVFLRRRALPQTLWRPGADWESVQIRTSLGAEYAAASRRINRPDDHRQVRQAHRPNGQETGSGALELKCTPTGRLHGRRL